MKRLLWYCMCMMVSLVVGGAFTHDIEAHQNFLVKKFDTSRWKTYGADDSWYIRCLFTDVNGDGIEDLITCSSSDEEDPVGYVWQFWLNDPNVGLVSPRMLREGIHWLCHSESFFKMVSDNGRQKLIGLGMYAGNTEGEFGKIVKATPDCVFQIGKESYKLRELSPDFDSVFMGNGPRFIERLYPEWYFGFDFKPPKDVPHNPYLQRPPYTKPKGDLRLGGGAGEPPGFVEFVNRYRKDMGDKSAAKGKDVAVHVVFLDVDNDGDADFYITSDLDRRIDGDYEWRLYLRQGGTCFMANDVVCPVPLRKDICKLQSIVKASKDSFCRIVRFDIDPIFFIFDRDKKDQVRNAIRDVNAHRVEKLPCRTYPDN